MPECGFEGERVVGFRYRRLPSGAWKLMSKKNDPDVAAVIREKAFDFPVLLEPPLDDPQRVYGELFHALHESNLKATMSYADYHYRGERDLEIKDAYEAEIVVRWCPKLQPVA
jgi:hypothetical protein